MLNTKKNEKKQNSFIIINDAENSVHKGNQFFYFFSSIILFLNLEISFSSFSKIDLFIIKKASFFNTLTKISQKAGFLLIMCLIFSGLFLTLCLKAEVKLFGLTNFFWLTLKFPLRSYPNIKVSPTVLSNIKVSPTILLQH